MTQHTFSTQFTTEFAFSQAKSAEINNNGSNLTVVYIHGLCSDPWGAKPEALKEICLNLGLNFFRFELAGHGSDKSNYHQADFNVWVSQVLEVIDNLVSEDILMLGSSIGGWLSLIAARERPKRIKGVVGLAAGPDFHEDCYRYAFTAEHIAALNRGEIISIGNKDFSYFFSKKLMDSFASGALLKSPIKVNCPVHLLQGMQDASLPWQKAIQIAELLESNQVEVKLMKNSNHRLATSEDLQEARNSLETLSKRLK